MAGIFSKIIKGEIPSYKVFEDEKCYAFLDINPNAVGHTLCVTKKEVDKIFDLSEEDYNHLMQFSMMMALWCWMGTHFLMVSKWRFSITARLSL